MNINHDLVILLAAVVGALGGVIASIISHSNHEKIMRIELGINGRIQELIDEVRAKALTDNKLAHAEGRIQGVLDGNSKN